VATISSPSSSAARSGFAQARCLVPNSRRRSSQQHARGAVAERGALVEHLQAAGRHQVDEEGERFRGTSAISRCRAALEGVEVDHGHLPDPPHGGDPPACENAERRVDALHRHHPRRQRRLHLDAGQRRAEPPRGDLDLGHLGHELSVRTSAS